MQSEEMTPPRVEGSYLLVVTDEDEVLACFAQGGDGVGLQHLCSLLYDHQTGTHFLQNFAELGCSCCCHANDLMEVTWLTLDLFVFIILQLVSMLPALAN